jgi:hypothetical protein
VHSSLLYGTILTGGLEVLGVWIASMTIHSGAAASWALLTGQSGGTSLARPLSAWPRASWWGSH